MLKNKTKIILIFLITILLFSTTYVFAENETNDEGIMLISDDSETNPISEDSITTEVESQKETYKKGDVYLTGNEVNIDYIVDGNIFVCANTVTINSQIGGDAFILAKKIIIEENGYIFSNLFTIAQSVEIKGVVYDVYALSKDLTLSKGYIYRDLKASVGTLNINGIVSRNAFVNCSTINFNTDEESNGIIYGDLNYSSSAKMGIPGGVVNGEVNYSASEESSTSVQSIISSYILDLGEFLAFLLIIWLLCLWLTPKFLANTNNYVGKKTLSLLGYGLIALIAIPIICIVLLLLQLTGAISIFLFALYVLALAITKSLFTITANNYVCSKLKINKTFGNLGMLILSGIVVWALIQIPYLGKLISFATIILGLGILVDLIIPKRAM